MKKLALAVALLGLLVAGQGAYAVIGTVDDVPSATLLLPYFEVTHPGAPPVTAGFAQVDINTGVATVWIGDDKVKMAFKVASEVQRHLAIFGTVPSDTCLVRTGKDNARVSSDRLETIATMFEIVYGSSSATSTTWAPPISRQNRAWARGYDHADLYRWLGFTPARQFRT